MKYKYNIKHRGDSGVETINFKNKDSMLKYLDSKSKVLNDLQAVTLYFNTIKLPLKQTVWYNKP